MTEEELNEWLDARWEQILASFEDEPDEEIDQFIGSSVVSIRYAFFTQLLGKLADPERDLLCSQRGSQETVPSGRWDPRSFCARVVVPWVRRNHNVLGTSADPYVNNPLRRPRLDSDMGSLSPGSRREWEALVGLLADLESGGDLSAIEETLERCLKSIARRLRSQSVVYPVPHRISLAHVCELLDRYLAVADGGFRPLVVATALMRTLGDAFSIFTRVDSQGLNEADAASGSPGDVLCYGNEDELVLAVEVKGHDLTYVELETTILKARSSGVADILFASPDFARADRDAIEARVKDEFAMGSNLHQTSIVGLVKATFSLLGEEWRVSFINAICDELDARSTDPTDRVAFAELLED